MHVFLTSWGQSRGLVTAAHGTELGNLQSLKDGNKDVGGGLGSEAGCWCVSTAGLCHVVEFRPRMGTGKPVMARWKRFLYSERKVTVEYGGGKWKLKRNHCS